MIRGIRGIRYQPAATGFTASSGAGYPGTASFLGQPVAAIGLAYEPASAAISDGSGHRARPSPCRLGRSAGPDRTGDRLPGANPYPEPAGHARLD